MALEPALTREERLRRVGIVCANFARNLAYYRASRIDGARMLPNANFWVTLEGNCIDVAVLEWCKLFGEQTGRHFWRNVVADGDRFKADLLVEAALTEAELGELIQSVRRYRDRFVAHLDDDRTMHIPLFDRLWLTTRYYFSHVVLIEMNAEERVRGGLTDLEVYYETCRTEASHIFARAAQA